MGKLIVVHCNYLLDSYFSTAFIMKTVGIGSAVNRNPLVKIISIVFVTILSLSVTIVCNKATGTIIYFASFRYSH